MIRCQKYATFRLLKTISMTTAAAALWTTAAFATEDDLDATIYGQLNFGALQVDNGSGRETYFAENPTVPSRVGVRWLFPLAGSSSLMIQLETGLGLTNLREVSPSNDKLEVDFARNDLRKFEIIYTSDQFGRLSLGQGSMASDGAAGADLSRTGLALGPSIGDLGGQTEFLAPDGTGSGILVGDVFDDLAGLRRLRVRYDTPDWQGFTLSVAHGTDVLRRGANREHTDIALAYALDTERFLFEAVASYEWIDSDEERAVASASLFDKPTGLNASLATGANQVGDGGYVYAKFGIVRELTRLGPTAFALEYYDGADLGLSGSRSEAIGVGLTQRIAPWDLDLVAALRRYQLALASDSFQDVDVVLLGARWRF